MFTQWLIMDSEIYGPYELQHFKLLDPYKGLNCLSQFVRYFRSLAESQFMVILLYFPISMFVDRLCQYTKDLNTVFSRLFNPICFHDLLLSYIKTLCWHTIDVFTNLHVLHDLIYPFLHKERLCI